MKKMISILFLITCSVVAAQEIPELKYEKITLSNGLDVILHEDHSTPMVSVNLWYHVGSKNEKRGRTGFAHLFEHLMFEGSENAPEGMFDKWLEAVGGIITALLPKTGQITGKMCHPTPWNWRYFSRRTEWRTFCPQLLRKNLMVSVML